MTTTISGPFGKYNYATAGGVLNALCAEGIPLNTVERLNISFDSDQSGVVKDGDKQFAKFKLFNGINKPLFYFQDQKFSQQTAIWGDDKKLHPKFHLSLYHHGNASLVIYKQRENDLFTQELYVFISGFIGAYVSHVMENSSDWVKKNHEMYKIRQKAGAFFQGGSNSFDEGFIYIEFWKPEGAQAFVDYINENFVYEGVAPQPEHLMEIY